MDAPFEDLINALNGLVSAMDSDMEMVSFLAIKLDRIWRSTDPDNVGPCRLGIFKILDIEFFGRPIRMVVREPHYKAVLSHLEKLGRCWHDLQEFEDFLMLCELKAAGETVLIGIEE